MAADAYGMDDDYSTPWLQNQPDPMAGVSSDFPGAASMTVDTDPVSSPGGGGINEAAQASPWLPDAPSGAAPAPAAAPGSVDPAVQSELDAHKMANDLTADGHDVSWNAQGQMMVDGRAYDVAGNSVDGSDGSAGSGPAPTPGAPGPAPGNDENQIQGWASQWLGRTFDQATLDGLKGQPLDLVMHNIANSPEALAYAAAHGKPAPKPAPTGATGVARSAGGGSSIDMSVPAWLTNMVPGYTPTLMDTTLSELPDFKTLFDSANGRNPNQAALDSLVGKVLEHPESLDEQAIQTLKGRAAEEAAVAAQANDEDLQHFAASSNLSDSPWLASARQANSQARRNTTIQANQNLDIAAADRTAADRRSAAQLGITAQNATTDRARAATSVALSGVLAKVNAQTTRSQLNEAFKQAATSLGISTAALATNYVLGHAGIQIDEKKLAAQSEQFQQDLALKIAQLKQQSDEYDANLQLELDKFQHQKDNDAWTKAQAAYAA